MRCRRMLGPYSKLVRAEKVQVRDNLLVLTCSLPSTIGECREVARLCDSRRDPRPKCRRLLLANLLASPKIVGSPRGTFKKTSIRVSHIGARLHHLRSGTGCPKCGKTVLGSGQRARMTFIKWGSSALNEWQLCTIDAVEIIKNDRPNAGFKRHRCVASRVLPPTNGCCRPTS